MKKKIFCLGVASIIMCSQLSLANNILASSNNENEINLIKGL